MSPSRARNDHPHEASGVVLGLLAYGIWGFVPLFWRLIGTMGAFELTVHRILWCAIL